MDRRSWLWRRKSSEKSPGETESTGSLSSHSERFFDDQILVQRSQSPELITKVLPRGEEEEDEATADVKILTERLSTALLNVSLKDDLAKQHAKVAEEAVEGWEKAEKEAAVWKQQLDASLTKISVLEDQKSHLDSALKECVRQLWQGREEWETEKSKLEARIEESVHEDVYAKLEALEKENSTLKQQLMTKTEEAEIKTIERDLSTQTAESASKQQLEGIKKLSKLEAECRKLRVLVRRSNDVKVIEKPSMVAPSVNIGLMDDFLEMEKLAALPNSEPKRRQETERISELEERVEMVEVEKVQLEMALNESKEQIEALKSRLSIEPKNQDLELLLSESRKQIFDLQRELSKAQVTLSELETIRAEKLELTICLNGTKKQLETSQNRLKETERKLNEVQTLLNLTKDAKEAAENGVKAANAKREIVEAESQSLNVKIECLEESMVKERALSTKHISKCKELQEEISKLKEELEHRQEVELVPRYFDEDFKMNQEKELAMAASKFAECQRTIASLGQRLQSLATLEDFLD